MLHAVYLLLASVYYFLLTAAYHLLRAYQARTARQLEGAALLALARYEEARLSSSSKKT